MSRDWVKLEVDRMVLAYKAGDWATVHAVIDRMLALDAGGAVVLTREEAVLAARTLRFARSRALWAGEVVSNLADRLEAAP